MIFRHAKESHASGINGFSEHGGVYLQLKLLACVTGPLPLQVVIFG
jgi:hypothetical protein